MNEESDILGAAQKYREQREAKEAEKMDCALPEPKYLLLRIPNFFARPGSNPNANYIGVSAKPAFEMIRKQLEVITGQARVVQERYHSHDLGVVFEIGQAPYASKLDEQWTDSPLVRNLCQPKHRRELSRAELPPAPTALTFTTNWGAKEDALGYLQHLATYDWASKPTGYGMDLYRRLCEPGNESLKIADIVGGNISLRGDGESYLVRGDLKAEDPEILRPVIDDLLTHPPKGGFARFEPGQAK